MILGVLTVAPITTSAAEENSESVSVTSGDFQYEVLCDDEISITGYSGSEENLTLPSTIDGYTVTEIGDDAFDYYRSLKSLIIPNTVASIGRYAFYHCTNLESVSISASVTYIDFSAFKNCDSLKSVTIPATVTYIGNEAFGYKYVWEKFDSEKAEDFTIYGYTNTDADVYAEENGFTFVSLGEVSPFEYEVYDDTVTITDYNGRESEVIIPSTIDGYTVTEIGHGAFVNCTTLESVTIPDSVEYIGDVAFASTNIKSLVIPERVTYIGDYAFEYCHNLESVTIPEGVEYIGDYAFGDAGFLEVTIPASVKYIGECAFGFIADFDYSFLETKEGFTIYGYTNSDADVYARENGLAFVSLGEVSPFEYELDDVFANITEYRGTETDVIIPSAIDGYTVTGIYLGAFEDNTSLESVVIPDTVTYIGDNAFMDCTSLASLTNSDTIIYIGESAFENCTSLESVTIPDSARYIGENAFANTGLSSVTIPENVMYIGNSAFGYYLPYEWSRFLVKKNDFTIYGYTNSEAEIYADDNGFSFESLGDASSFAYEVYEDVACITKYRGSDADVVIPSEIDGYTVTEIGWGAFEGCTSLTGVEIPDTVTYIGGFAFIDCTNLKSVTIPASVTNIGYCAFGYSYYEDEWDYVKDESFTIYGYTNSEADAYARDNGFKFVSLGEVSPFVYEVYDDVVCITDYNGSEANVTIPSEIDGYTVTEIGWSAFECCNSLTSVTIPDGVTDIGDYAFAECSNLESVTIPDGVTYIGEYAFAECSSLESVTIPASVTNIGECAFGYTFDYDEYEYVKADGFTIYGYTGSEAEIYANENGFKFKNIGDAPSPTLGDVNGDGSISIDDATAIQKHLANMLDFSEEQAEAADVDNNGDITIDDVTLIQKYLAGLAEI